MKTLVGGPDDFNRKKYEAVGGTKKETVHYAPSFTPSPTPRQSRGSQFFTSAQSAKHEKPTQQKYL